MLMLSGMGPYLPQVERVYVLVRAKGSLAPQQRVAALFRSGLFHSLRNTDAALRVVPIEGDLARPNLGVSEGDRAMLKSDVHFILHCAAAQERDCDVQDSLR
jgi:thioester reductase-like protein